MEGSTAVRRNASMTGPSAGPAWVRDLRASARERLNAMAWPTPAEEEWRRTDITRMDFSPFMDGRAAVEHLARTRSTATLSDGHMEPDSSAGIARIHDDAPELTMLCAEAQEQGVRLLPLSEAWEEFEGILAPMFSKALAAADNRFIAWHIAEAGRGVLLYVPPGAAVDRPFSMEQIGGGRVLSSPHTVVFLDRGSRATVVRITTGGGAFLSNDGLDIVVSDGASLSFWDLQALDDEPLQFSHGRAVVGRDASLRHFAASLGGRLVKTRVDCLLEGSGADARLSGMYLCGASQHMDVRTVQRHEAKSATSRAFYKGAVKDDGRTVFQGLIEVGAGASGTDAFLTNKNLILSDGARSDSIPSLKIGNNDVKCSHGSTTGRIDQEHIFYLESRGLSAREARQMIVLGYFEELLADAPQGFTERTLSRTRALLENEAPAPAPRAPAPPAPAAIAGSAAKE